MNPMPRRTLVLALAALVALALGYWGYRTYARSELHKAVAELVKDSSGRLQTGLAVETGATPDTPQTVAKLDDLAQEVDKHVIELSRMDASLDRPFMNAAEEYLLTARQVLRNQAASHRYRTEFEAGDRALRDHMRTAGRRRSAAWIQGALRAKERVERDYFNYRLAAEALGRLLASYPEVRRKLALYVGAALLADETAARNARRRALETSKRVAGDVERARQLASVR